MGCQFTRKPTFHIQTNTSADLSLDAEVFTIKAIDFPGVFGGRPLHFGCNNAKLHGFTIRDKNPLYNPKVLDTYSRIGF